MISIEQDSPPEVIGFLLVPRFSMMAFVSALEPLRVANRLAQRTLYQWEILSQDGGPVAASSDLTLLADRAMADATQHDRLVVAASFAPEAAFDRAPGPACWTATAPRRTGKAWIVSPSSFPASMSAPACSSSTARASPAPAAPRRST